MALDLSDSNEAFIIQGEMKEVRDRLRDIDQTVTVITQNVMVKVDGIVDELSKQPDGSRFPMSDAHVFKSLHFLAVSSPL